MSHCQPHSNSKKFMHTVTSLRHFNTTLMFMSQRHLHSDHKSPCKFWEKERKTENPERGEHNTNNHHRRVPQPTSTNYILSQQPTPTTHWHYEATHNHHRNHGDRQNTSTHTYINTTFILSSTSVPSSITTYITTPFTSTTQYYHLIHQLNTINTKHKHRDHHTTLQKQIKTHPYSPWIHLSININNNKHNHNINAITNTSLYQQHLQRNHTNITPIRYLFTHFMYVFIYACPFTHFIYAYVYAHAFTHLVHRHQLQQKEQQHSYISLTHCSIDTQQQHVIQSTPILHRILPTIQNITHGASLYALIYNTFSSASYKHYCHTINNTKQHINIIINTIIHIHTKNWSTRTQSHLSSSST